MNLLHQLSNFLNEVSSLVYIVGDEKIVVRIPHVRPNPLSTPFNINSAFCSDMSTQDHEQHPQDCEGKKYDYFL